jgi:hypothetical protein
VLQESGIQLVSVTADGDSDIHRLVEQQFEGTVLTYQDPNHYAKGLAKNLHNLCDTYPVLVDLADTLKCHFLIGT